MSVTGCGSGSPSDMPALEFIYQWPIGKKRRWCIAAKHPGRYYCKHPWVKKYHLRGNSFLGISKYEDSKEEPIYTAYRVIRFMDETGFRPSMAKFSSFMKMKEFLLPTYFEHICIWRDQDNRYVVTIEMYDANLEKRLRLSTWAIENSCTIEESNDLGMWHPPYTTMFLIKRM